MTAHAMKGDRERCLAAGMDAYVAKPVRDEELREAIRLTAPQAFEDRPGAADTVDFDVPTPPPPVDESAVLARVGGNRDTLRDLIGVFYQDCSVLMADLDAAIREGEAPKLRTAAHTIKGMVSFFGAPAAVDVALKLEKAGERGDVAEAARLFPTLAREIDTISAALTPYSDV
jgi:HPt (histidine-containing phosphotransfer) domain-containing protein